MEIYWRQAAILERLSETAAVAAAAAVAVAASPAARIRTVAGFVFRHLVLQRDLDFAVEVAVVPESYQSATMNVSLR